MVSQKVTDTAALVAAALGPVAGPDGKRQVMVDAAAANRARLLAALDDDVSEADRRRIEAAEAKRERRAARRLAMR